METTIQKNRNTRRANGARQLAALALTLIAVLAIFASFSAAAAEKLTVVMDSLEMTITIPDQYIVYTQDGLSDKSESGASGDSDEEIISYMKENSIYLNALSKESTHEIVITCVDDDTIRDTNEISNAILSTLMGVLVTQLESYGITPEDESIYNSPNRRYMRIAYSMPTEEGEMHGIQYITVFANKGVNITLRSYAGEIPAALETEIKTIIDSVELAGSQTQTNPDYQPSDAFAYTDPETKTTFTVPKNWVEEPLSKDRETIDVKFSSLEDEGLSILYGSTDVLPLLSLGSVLEGSRYLVDNSVFTKDVIADVLEIDDSQIEVVKYGANEFYQYSTKTTVDTLGIPMVLNMTYFITVDHGYMYFIQFNGTPADEHFPDLESLLTGMKFGNP